MLNMKKHKLFVLGDRSLAAATHSFIAVRKEIRLRYKNMNEI